MRIELDLDAAVLKGLVARYPQAMDNSINVFKDTVGYTLERQVKSRGGAPHVSGNLKRQTFYSRSVNDGSASVHSYAEYAKYVHGEPYYTFDSLTTKKGRARKITPFFTNALINKQSLIKAEAKNILKRVLT